MGVFEDPPGRFHGLEIGKEYFVYVMEDETEFLRAQEGARLVFGHPTPSAERTAVAADAKTILRCRTCQWVGAPRSKQTCPKCGSHNCLAEHEPFQKFARQSQDQEVMSESDVYGASFDQVAQEARREAYNKGLVGEAHWAFVQKKMAQYNSAS